MVSKLLNIQDWIERKEVIHQMNVLDVCKQSIWNECRNIKYIYNPLYWNKCVCAHSFICICMRIYLSTFHLYGYGSIGTVPFTLKTFPIYNCTIVYLFPYLLSDSMYFLPLFQSSKRKKHVQTRFSFYQLFLCCCYCWHCLCFCISFSHWTFVCLFNKWLHFIIQFIKRFFLLLIFLRNNNEINSMIV